MNLIKEEKVIGVNNSKKKKYEWKVFGDIHEGWEGLKYFTHVDI